MRWLTAAVFLLASPVWAADYHLTLSADEVNYIGQVLGKEPFKDVAPLLLRMQKQIDEQNQAIKLKAEGEKHGKGIDGSGNDATPKGHEEPRTKSP